MAEVDYRDIVESCGGLLCRFQRDGSILFSNPAHADLRGRSLADLMSSTLWELMEPETAARLREQVSRLDREKPQTVFEEELPGESEDRWIIWTISTLEFDAGDQVQSFQALGLDITECKRSGMAMADSEARLHLALEAANAGVWSVDLRSGEATCSHELADLYGYPPEMLPNYERWIARVHPDDQERLQTTLDNYLNGNVEQFEQEFRIVHPERGTRWILDLGRVVRDREGTAIRIYGISMDITDRRLSEEALRQSERRFRHLAEAVPSLVWVMGPDGTFSYVNHSWTEYTGLTSSQMETMGWADLVHPDDHQTIRLLKGNQPGETEAHGEVRLRRFDREYRWHTFKVVILVGAEGEYKGCYGASLDIHGHRKLEQALRNSEALFRMIADTAPILLWITESNGNCTYLSKGWLEYTGLSAQIALGWGWTQTIHPEDRQRAVKEFSAATSEQREYELHYRMRHMSGQYRWVLVRGRPRFSPTGEFLGHIGSIIDIHERTEAEERLRQSEEWFRTLADNMSQLAWMANAEGRLIWFNRRWYEFTGASEDRSVNWRWVEFVHPEHRDRVIRKIQHSWDTGEAWEDTFQLRGRNGQYRWFLSRAMPIRDDGKITRWFGTHTDITEQREAEDALRNADQRKNEFLATLAHELRNPLAPLRNGLEIIQLASDDKEAREKALEVMQRQLDHMVRLIDDLLDLSRISRGKVRLNKQVVALRDVISQAVELSRPKIETQALDFHVTMPPEHCFVYGDPTRLSQIFANLLNNSAKFTARGGSIWLTAEILNREVQVKIKDNGIGIPPELLPEVFEMFAQGDRIEETAHGGLGVGLALVKGLVELHDGSVTARSEGRGKGSEFTVVLPLAEAAAEEIDGKRPPSLPVGDRHQVLVVDDNPDSATSMATMLELLGHETRTAHDGLQALAEAATFRPDIILLDIGMPKMNGYDVARRIRQQDWGKDVVLVAVTGWGQEEDRRRSREAGFDYHLVKPADLADIQDVLQGRAPKRRN